MEIKIQNVSGQCIFEDGGGEYGAYKVALIQNHRYGKLYQESIVVISHWLVNKSLNGVKSATAKVIEEVKYSRDVRKWFEKQ